MNEQTEVPSDTITPTGENICASEINYDRSLPGLHRYLGGDFVDVGGRTFLEPGLKTRMCAFYRDNVILVPGQSLPLLPYGSLESDLLEEINREKRPLIFLPGCFDHRARLEDLVGCVGTTADLVAICVPDREEDAPIRAIFVGRQRIRIIKARTDSKYPFVCDGVILPEVSLDHGVATHPLGWGLIPRSWSRFAADPRPSVLNSRDPVQLPEAVQHSKSSNDRSSTQASSLSLQPQICPSFLIPSGNASSMFDSRLSTWRYYGPINSGSISSSSCSPKSKLDHFVGDVMESESVSEHKIDTDTNEQQKSMHHNLEYEQSSSVTRSASLCEDVELVVDRAVDRVGRPFRYKIRQRCEPRLLARRDVLAATAQSILPFPIWVYRQYDLHFLVSTIQIELYRWNDTWQVGRWTPELAVPFSFWLLQNLPMSGELKAHILGIDHVVQRLRALLDIIRHVCIQSTLCVCTRCDANITLNQFIICLAQEGSFQTYVNPSGVLHDIVTLSQVTPNSVSLVGVPSEEYSWFPGYSWTIANCSNCSHHLGWLFTSVKDHLKPNRFWGIRRDAIKPGLVNNHGWRPCQ